MVQNTTETERGAATGERRSIHLIHYDLSYTLYGAAHGTDGALVLLHDIVGGGFSWEPVLAELGDPGRAIYVIDLLGYGRSEHPWPADTSLWGHADYLAIFLKQLNLTNAVLVGYGIGGGVAQILATRLSPERVGGLVLIDSAAYLHSFAENWPLTKMKERQDPDAPLNTPLADVLSDLKATLPAASYRPERFKEALASYVEPWDSEVGKEVLFQHIRDLRPYYGNAVSTDLRSLKVPALIIWGEQDQQSPLKDGQRLAREIPQAGLVTIPEAGHMVLFDAPGTVASALADFIGKL